MPTSVEVWPYAEPVASSTPELVDGQIGQAWHRSRNGLEADVPSFQTNIFSHSQSFKTSPSSEAGNFLFHQLKPSITSQGNACQTTSPSQRSILSSRPDDKVPPTRPKRHREMYHGQNKEKRASMFDAQNTSQPPRAATRAKHGSRGRKPNVAQPRLIMTPPQQLDAVDEELIDDEFELYDMEAESLTQDPQRQGALKRNRIAAKKCRGRKRDGAAALATREHEVETQNRYLSTCYDSLTTEVYLLKSELLRHYSCNCTLIQKYINNEARKSVENMNSSPPSIKTDNQATPTHMDCTTRASSYFDSEFLKLEGRTNTENPEFESSGSPRESAVQVADDNHAAFQDAFNHWHKYIQDDTTKPSHDCGQTYQHPAGTYDHASIYLAGYNDRANEQALGYSFNASTGFEPSFRELKDVPVQISSSYS
ncbi:transcription factor atf21 [Paramyrothecium foliicola]|nr:transcription factor atf21 [Paramyrothecium foliicola]